MSGYIYATRSAFAALKTDSSVVSWGSKNSGGDSSQVKAQLSVDVRSIYSNDRAFAAKKSLGVPPTDSKI